MYRCDFSFAADTGDEPSALDYSRLASLNQVYAPLRKKKSFFHFPYYLRVPVTHQLSGLHLQLRGLNHCVIADAFRQIFHRRSFCLILS